MPEKYGVGEIKSVYDSVLNKYEKDPTDPLVSLYANKHGISVNDLGAGAAARRKLLANPEDKGALAVNNDLFQKISDKLPAEQLGFFDVGGGYRSDKGGIIPYAKALTARTLVNNTISNNLDLQAQYFSRKGYISRVVGDRVEIRKPNEIGFRPIEKEGIDLFDTLDIVDDVLQGAAEGAKITAKTAGAATGLGIPIAMGIAGATGGAFEAGRQAAGKIVGTRDEYDFPQILKESVISATFPGAQVALGAGLKAGAKGVTKATGLLEGLKPNVDTIKESAKRLGTKLLPGQISESRIIQEMTEGQYRANLGWFGPYAISAKKIVKDTYRKIDDELTNMLSDKAGVNPSEAGQKAFEQAVNVIEAKKDAAQELYNAATHLNFYKNAKVDTSEIKAQLEYLKDVYQGEPNVQSLISKYESALEGVSNLRGLTNIKSALGSEIRVKGGKISGMEIKALGEMESAVKQAFDANFDEFEKKAAQGLFKTKPEDIKAARAAKMQADKMWYSLMSDLSVLTKRPGKNVRGGPDEIIEQFIINNPAEKFVDKILATNDIKKVMAVRERFPEAFETLRQGKLQQYWNKWAPKETLVTKTAISDLSKMPSNVRNLLFGENADQKVRDLIVVYESIPKDINPSGTGRMLQILNGNIFSAQVGSFIRGVILSLSKSSADLGQGLLLNLGKTLEGKRALQAAGIGKQGVRQLLPSEQSPEDNYILLPNMNQ